MFPIGFTGCIGQVVFSTLWACWASRHKESFCEDSISVGHNVSQKNQWVACIVCEFTVSHAGTRGQSGYILAESSLSAQDVVISVHESTYSAGSIHVGGRGLAGSHMPHGTSWTSFLSVLAPARKEHLCQNKGFLTGWRTLLWKHIVWQAMYCLQLLNVIPLEQWFMQHYRVCPSLKYVRQLHGHLLAHSQDFIDLIWLNTDSFFIFG